MSELQRLYSAAEAAKVLKLHVNTVKRAIAQGQIKSAKMGSVHRITAQELERVVERGIDLAPEPRPAAHNGQGRPRKAR